MFNEIKLSKNEIKSHIFIINQNLNFILNSCNEDLKLIKTISKILLFMLDTLNNLINFKFSEKESKDLEKIINEITIECISKSKSIF